MMSAPWAFCATTLQKDANHVAPSWTNVARIETTTTVAMKAVVIMVSVLNIALIRMVVVSAAAASSSAATMEPTTVVTMVWSARARFRFVFPAAACCSIVATKHQTFLSVTKAWSVVLLMVVIIHLLVIPAAANKRDAAPMETTKGVLFEASYYVAKMETITKVVIGGLICEEDEENFEQGPFVVQLEVADSGLVATMVTTLLAVTMILTCGDDAYL
jgi:hypothetical protein